MWEYAPTFSVRKPCLCGWPAGSGIRGTGCWPEAAPSDPLSVIRFPSLHLPAMEKGRGDEMMMKQEKCVKFVNETHSSSDNLPGSRTSDR